MSGPFDGSYLRAGALVAEPVRMSFSQESLWLTQELVPDLSQYLMVITVDLDGDLDRTALERSVDEIVRRHDLLRCTLERVDGVPSIVPHACAAPALTFVDLTGVPAGPARDAAAKALIGRWYVDGFDLGVPPLLRGELLKLTSRSHVLVLATHHIVADEESLTIVKRELSHLYAAYSAGRQPDLPDLPVQFTDYARWQRAELEGDLESGLAYWEKRLAALPVMNLPADAPRPAVRRFSWSWHTLALQPDVMTAVVALARRRETTPFCVLLAVFDLLMSQWSGQREVIVGTPVGGRHEPDVAGLIGFFVNSVALRTHCDTAEPFTDLLDRVQAGLAADLAHDYVPFHRVVERINPPRDSSRHPLFQVAFHTTGDTNVVDATVVDATGGEMRLAGLAVADRTLDYLCASDVSTEFDLVVEVVAERGAPVVRFRYAAELFEPATIEELGEQFGRTLRGVLADPDAPPPAAAFVPRGAPAADARKRTGARPSGGPRAPVSPVSADAALDVFAAELGVPEVRLGDDFFAVGGSSLVGASVVDRLRRELGLEPALIDLFLSQSIGEFLALCGISCREAPEADGPDADGPDADGLVRRPAAQAPPLSHAQSRLWFLNQLVGGQDATYNSPVALRIHGPLDVAALILALADLAERHEVLRTLLPERDGRPFQQVLSTRQGRPRVRVQIVAERNLDAFVRLAVARPFDLTTDLPWRPHIFCTGEDSWLLLLVIHHVACDAWSMGPLMRDLRTAYCARVLGRPPQWAALPVQYADYAVWQRQQLGDENDPASTIAQQLAYWSAALADLPDAIRLPTDRPRPVGKPTHQGGSVELDLGPRLYRDLLELARRMRCSLLMVLQAGVAALLTRYGAGTDIPLGCPVAGRGNRKLDDLVGFFSNTLVLRVDTSGDPTFEDLLSQVRARSLEAYEHQDVPFERLVERLCPAHSLARQLFQVLVNHNGSAAGTDPLGGLATEPVLFGTPVAVFDLAIQFVEGRLDPADAAGGSGAVSLLGEIEFNADIFESQTVERLAGSLRAIYRAMADDPQRRIGDADLVPAAQAPPGTPSNGDG